MKTTLKIGDSVETIVPPPIPPLVFVIEKFQTINGQQLACGSYGCFAIDLITKSGQKS